MSPARTSPKQASAAGSPLQGEPVFLAVGKLRRPHGVHGEILMDVYTDYPERLAPGVVVYAGETHLALQVTGRRWHQEALLLSFEGYTTPEQVGRLRNLLLYVRASDCPPLEPGEFYHHQLIGLRVVDEAGDELGRVSGILETGANDVFIVQPASGPEILLPYIDTVILTVNLAKGEMQVRLLPGLVAGEEDV